MSTSMGSSTEGIVGASIRDGWETFKRQPWLLIAGLLALAIATTPFTLLSQMFTDNGQPTVLSSLVSFLSVFVSIPLGAGMAYLALKLVRQDPTAEFATLLAGFNRYVDLLVGTLVVVVICSIGFVLLIVPGIIAGIGLMRLGLEQAGWHTVWANDHDPMKRAFYRHNLVDEEVTVDGRSIQDVPPRSVPRAGLISACFPCTDLSLAGAVRGLEAGPQSSAYLRFATILAELGARRPPFVILENVVGLIHSHAGKDFRLCLQRLADAGYRVDAVKIDAVHFVPQSRPRLFLMGVREDIALTPCRTPAFHKCTVSCAARLVI